MLPEEAVNDHDNAEQEKEHQHVIQWTEPGQPEADAFGPFSSLARLHSFMTANTHWL
jgi:hypothetical protein